MVIEIVCRPGTNDHWKSFPSCWFVAFRSWENSDLYWLVLGSCVQTGLLLPAQLLWSLSLLLLWAWPGWGCSSKVLEPRWRGSGWKAIYLCKGPLCSLLPRGLECPVIPRFPASGLSVLSCPFKTSKKHSPPRGAGFSHVCMWSGCFPVSSALYFRKIFLCYIFIALCVFGRRFPLLYSRRHLLCSIIVIFD